MTSEHKICNYISWSYSFLYIYPYKPPSTCTSKSHVHSFMEVNAAAFTRVHRLFAWNSAERSPSPPVTPNRTATATSRPSHDLREPCVSEAGRRTEAADELQASTRSLPSWTTTSDCFNMGLTFPLGLTPSPFGWPPSPLLPLPSTHNCADILERTLLSRLFVPFSGFLELKC